MNNGRLLLVDGHGLAFRGFYALPPMNAPDGTPTNAILGFMGMLLKAMDEWKPAGVGLFFDPKGPTHRDKLYAKYKEGRPPAPDEFRVQMPLILELSSVLGFPVFIEEGVEADDLIAASAVAAAGEGWETIILSADKDLLQLLRDGLRVARPAKGVSEMKLYDAGSFESEYGFPPSAMADYLALVGDAADNIPGVPGVGDKTARELLSAYGSLDGIYGSLDELAKARRNKLAAGREMAYWSKSLVVPQDVAPVKSALLRRADIRYPEALALCRRLGLKRLSERLSLADMGSGYSPPQAAHRPEAVLCGVQTLLAAPELALAGDPPTLAAPDGRYAELRGEDWNDLFSWLGANRLTLADYRRWCGVEPRLRDYCGRILDVEMAHYFLHPDAKTHAFADISENGAAGGAAAALEILRLWRGMSAGERADDMVKIMTEIDGPLTPALLRLQERGIALDAPAMKKLERDLSERTGEIVREIYRISGSEVNLNSPKQVGALLFEKLGLPVIKKTKTGYSTDVSVLEELSRLPQPFCDVPAKMLEYRECSKMSSGFVQPFLSHAAASADGRVHSTFLHTVTGTGRLASRDPNAQNLPVFGGWAERFRSALVPGGAGRVFVSADYSQIELRVLAHLCGEERLLEAFAKGRDIHLETASWVFGLPPEDITGEQRRFAKTVNFGLIYGMGAHGLGQRMGIERHQAVKLVDRYFAVLPKVKEYLEVSARTAKAAGYTRSVFGRIRPLAEVTTVEGRGGGSIDRVAVNTPIQSTAADIAKIALVRFDEVLRRRGGDTFLVLQVHDSLVCESPAAAADEIEALLIETMEGVKAIDVPLKAEPKRGTSLAAI